MVPVSLSVSLHTLLSTPLPASTSAPALLLLHFWGGTNRTFAALSAHLRPHMPLIVPSLRGWGRSSRLLYTGAYRTADHVADIAALLSYLRQERPEIVKSGVVLAGHSMGGKVAQALLARQEVAGLPEGMVLIAPAPAGRFALPEGMREGQMQAYRSREAAEGAVRNLLLGSPQAVEDQVVEALVGDAVGGATGAR